MLDDYHLIQAPAVHTSVEFLLEHLPSSLRLVLASRADPPLPLARLRGRGQLAELREADLRFTPQEAGELLGATVGAELPEEAVAALGNRTEGWAAGLQLAALSLQGRSDIGAFVEGFSGSHRYVLDYLAEEVLDRQPPQLRTFLLESSVLERLSGPLCDAVTGRADSQQLLEQVERANLFLQPLDAVRGWWRYHQLFADLLRARLQQQRPERVPELHRAAAGWCEAARAGRRRHRSRASRRRPALGGPAGRAAFRGVGGPPRGRHAAPVAGAAAGRGGGLPAAAVPAPRLLGADRQPGGGGGAAAGHGRARVRRCRRGAVRAGGRPGGQPGGEHPGGDRPTAGQRRPPPRRRHPDDRLRPPGPGRAGRGRVDAGIGDRLATGRRRVAAGPGGGGRTRLPLGHLQPRRLARHRAADPGRMGL